MNIAADGYAAGRIPHRCINRNCRDFIELGLTESGQFIFGPKGEIIRASFVRYCSIKVDRKEVGLAFRADEAANACITKECMIQHALSLAQQVVDPHSRIPLVTTRPVYIARQLYNV